MRMKLSIGLLCFVQPAWAAQVDFTAVLQAQDGKPKMECLKLGQDRTKCEEEIVVTLGWLCRIALDMAEDKLPISEIIKRGSLAEKILNNDKLDLSVDEAKLVKDQIIKLNYSVSIRYQAISLIDPQGVKDAK